MLLLLVIFGLLSIEATAAPNAATDGGGGGGGAAAAVAEATAAGSLDKLLLTASEVGEAEHEDARLLLVAEGVLESNGHRYL